jgi:hypothetical protein
MILVQNTKSGKSLIVTETLKYSLLLSTEILALSMEYELEFIITIEGNKVVLLPWNTQQTGMLNEWFFSSSDW